MHQFQLLSQLLIYHLQLVRAQEPEIAFLADYLDPSVALQSLETMVAYTGEEPGFRERLYSTGNYYLDTDLTAESLEFEYIIYIKMDQMKIAIFALTVSSVLGKVKCDSGELMSTCILIILVFILTN